MLYMVIERFRERDAAAVYRRLEERGRMLPDGLAFHQSWVETNHDRCFQLMRCAAPALLETLADTLRDLFDFKFVPFTPAAAARAAALCPAAHCRGRVGARRPAASRRYARIGEIGAVALGDELVPILLRGLALKQPAAAR